MTTSEIHPKDGWALIAFASAAEFEGRLEEHRDDETGLWLKIAKKASGIASITYDEAVDVALCFGWIDGQRNSLDGDYFLQRFSPRRSRSIWSKVNTEKVAAMTAAGRMRPTGQAQVDKAKDDGRWAAAYDRLGAKVVPPDLQQVLDNDPAAAAFFSSLSSSSMYAFTFRLQTAKRPRRGRGGLPRWQGCSGPRDVPLNPATAAAFMTRVGRLR